MVTGSSVRPNAPLSIPRGRKAKKAPLTKHCEKRCPRRQEKQSQSLSANRKEKEDASIINSVDNLGRPNGTLYYFGVKGGNKMFGGWL